MLIRIYLFLKKHLSWDNLELTSLLSYFRFISLLVTSGFYLLVPPLSPFWLKAGVCICLLLESYFFIRVYSVINAVIWKKVLILGETISLALILILTGGLDSPFLWYAINPILLGATHAPAYFCWAMMGIFVICAVVLQQFSVYVFGPAELLKTFRPERASLVVIFILITFGAQLFNFLVRKLSRQARIMEKQLQHIKSLYEAVQVLTFNHDPQEVVSLFASYSRALTGAKKVIAWVETGSGHTNAQKKNYFAVRGPRDIFLEESWYPYIKKVFETKYSAPELSVQKFPAATGQDPGILLTVRIKSGANVFGVLSAFYPGAGETPDNVEQTLTFLADLCGISLEKSLQEALTEQLLLIEEKDRIAGEIHDNVTHNMFGVIYALDNLIKKEPLDEAVRKQLRFLQKTVQRSLKDLRNTIYCMSAQKNLREPFLDDVQTYLSDLGQLNYITVKFDYQGNFNNVRSFTRNSLYRIIREASGNAIRHGGCDTLDVFLKADNGTLELTIKDDGCGFVAENYEHGDKPGLGILNMKELARGMGGDLSIESSPGKGTTVYCKITTVTYICSSS